MGLFAAENSAVGSGKRAPMLFAEIRESESKRKKQTLISKTVRPLKFE